MMRKNTRRPGSINTAAKSRRLAPLAVFPIVCIGYLALRGSPWVGEIGWVPDFIGKWADQNGNFRNCPAFMALALILIALSGVRVGSLISLLLGVGLECAQLFIPGRIFDWADIGWSCVGVVLATGVWVGGLWLWRRFSRVAGDIPADGRADEAAEKSMGEGR